MIADQYLHGILPREAVDAGPNSPLLGMEASLMPILRQSAGDNLVGVYPNDGASRDRVRLVLLRANSRSLDSAG